MNRELMPIPIGRLDWAKATPDLFQYRRLLNFVELALMNVPENLVSQLFSIETRDG